MNAGLANRETLKRYLLPTLLQEDTTYDNKVLAIGLGVAGLLDNFCNRRLGYAVNDTLVFSGDRPHYYLPRYPIVSVTTIEMRYFLADPWVEITGQPISWNQESGLLHFGYTLGRWPLQVRATWTGGFWYETLEPAEPGYPTSAPAGATLLPDALKLAWLTMCAETWNKLDKLGTGIAQAPDKATGNWQLDLPPLVKVLLQPYIRYQLS